MRLYDEATAGAVSRARSLRRNETDAERLLWRELRRAFPCARFRRQVPVGPFTADFLSFGALLIVEADGGQHVDQAEQDAARTRFLVSQGYRVVRFWNSDILANTAGVLESVAAALAPCGRV